MGSMIIKGLAGDEEMKDFSTLQPPRKSNTK